MAALRVSSHSDPNAVASALAMAVNSQGSAEIESTGANGLNQAVKSIALARGFLAPSGRDLVCWPAFADVEIDGPQRSQIKLFVEFAPSEH